MKRPIEYVGKGRLGCCAKVAEERNFLRHIAPFFDFRCKSTALVCRDGAQL